MIKILLVEDDKSIITTITYYLQREGFRIESANTEKMAIEKLNNSTYQLVLLDVTLPDGNGYDLYSKIKKIQNIPVIFLTALDEEKDIVKGFDLGADDYITKPFHARELLSRIKNVMRHYPNCEEEKKIKISNIVINITKQKVYNGENEVELTALEYKILLLLFRNRGKIISREQILSEIWDENENYVNDNTLTVYIKRIREKIGDENSNLIKTVRGLGYKIME